MNVSDPETGTSVGISPGQAASVDPAGSFTVSATGGAELPVIHNSAGGAMEEQQSGMPDGVGPSSSSEGNGNGGNASAGGGKGNGNGGSNSDSANSGNDKGNNGNAGERPWKFQQRQRRKQ